MLKSLEILGNIRTICGFVNHDLQFMGNVLNALGTHQESPENSRRPSEIIWKYVEILLRQYVGLILRVDYSDAM